MALRKDIAAALARTDRPPRLTVVRAGALGDTILTLPVLQLLRQMAPQVQITLVGSIWAERLAPLIGFPLRLVRFDSAALTPLFAPEAQADPTGAFAGADAAILYVHGVHEVHPVHDLFVQNARRLCPGPVVAWPVEPPTGVHAAVHFASAIATDVAAPLPALRVPPDLRAWARRRLDEAVGPNVQPIAVHPGSGGRPKCWPAEQFAQLIRAMRRPVVLLCGPADDAACAAVVALLPPEVRPVELAGLEVAQAGAVLAECGLYVGNDSGLTHLAAGLGVSTVAVFGPTDTAVWRPLGLRVRVACGADGRPWPWSKRCCPFACRARQQ